MNRIALREGGCLCGAVRYRVRGTPSSTAYCHCRVCQRSAGAPAIAWFTVSAVAFTVTNGALREYASSALARRGFCPHCGSQITFRYRAHGLDMVDVTVASLDDPDALPPERHIWTGSRIAWFEAADSLPRHVDNGPDLTPE